MKVADRPVRESPAATVDDRGVEDPVAPKGDRRAASGVTTINRYAGAHVRPNRTA